MSSPEVTHPSSGTPSSTPTQVTICVHPPFEPGRVARLSSPAIFRTEDDAKKQAVLWVERAKAVVLDKTVVSNGSVSSEDTVKETIEKLSPLKNQATESGVTLDIQPFNKKTAADQIAELWCHTAGQEYNDQNPFFLFVQPNASRFADMLSKEQAHAKPPNPATEWDGMVPEMKKSSDELFTLGSVLRM